MTKSSFEMKARLLDFDARLPKKRSPRKFYAKSDGWTKETIYDQLDRDGDDRAIEFKVKDITNVDAQWWVEEESGMRDQFHSEEAYVDLVEELNNDLCKRILDRFKKKSR